MVNSQHWSVRMVWALFHQNFPAIPNVRRASVALCNHIHTTRDAGEHLAHAITLLNGDVPPVGPVDSAYTSCAFPDSVRFLSNRWPSSWTKRKRRPTEGGLNFDPRADSNGNGQVSEFEPLADARPLTLAQAFLRFAGHAATATKPLTLRHWRQELYEFDGSVYRKVKAEQFYAELKLFLNQQAVTKQGNRGQWAEPVNATKKFTGEVMDQLRVICQVPEDVMPQWLDAHRPDPGNVIAFKNGWIDISKYLLGEQGIQNPITPFWFSQNLIPYDFRPGIGCPHWLEFLNSSLEGDAERIQLVQEWFGYCLTTDTRLQNILWLQGPAGVRQEHDLRRAVHAAGPGQLLKPEPRDAVGKVRPWRIYLAATSPLFLKQISAARTTQKLLWLSSSESPAATSSTSSAST
jgi:hypothetical protein